MMISSCGGGRQPGGAATITPTLTGTATYPPTLTPTPVPLGSPDNPFVIGLVSENYDPQVTLAGEELARQVSILANITVRTLVYPSFEALIDDLAAQKVHVMWLPPLTYLYARSRDLASVFLLTNQFGVYEYGAQYMANVESGFTPYFDPISGYNSVDAYNALYQFQDKRPCWVEPQSPSGYIVPAGLLKVNGYSTLPAVIAQSHTAVIRSLYIKGVCDFGATFSISGDPRTAAAVQQDLPAATNRIIIIWRSDSIIPNLNLSFSTQLSELERQTLATAFLEIGKSQDGKDIFSISAGNYQIDDIRTFNDEVYDPLRDLVRSLDIDLEETIGK